MVLVVFLLMISMAMALSFAMLRTEGTSVSIGANQLRHARARLAAETGLLLGLEKMHQASQWGGASSTFTHVLSNTDSVVVSYLPGDPKLTAADPDWEKYAYRVTIHAQGISLDVLHPGANSTEDLDMVVELVPVQLTAEPTDWANFAPFTLYQGKNKTVQIELATRIEGPVRLQGDLTIADKAPTSTAPRDQYLVDLEAMRVAGLGDYRTFSGPVSLDYSTAGSGLTSLGQLGVSTINIPQSGCAADWKKPSGPATYQIYDGGPTYSVPTLGGTLVNQSFDADPLTNPLGFFVRNGSLNMDDTTSIHGTLFCKDNFTLIGTNVQLQAVDLPPLEGTTAPVQMPAVTCQNLTVETGASAGITGLVAVFDKMDIKDNSDSLPLAIEGKVIIKKDFKIQERTEWAAMNWDFWYSVFTLSNPQGPMQYYPYFMSAFPMNLNYVPVVTLKPPASPVAYHWGTSPSGPIYIRGPTDPGLRWDVVWRD